MASDVPERSGSPGRSLRGKILSLILFAFVPAVVVNLLAGYEYRRTATRDASKETLGLVRIATRDYEETIFRTTPTLLGFLAKSHPELQAQDGSRTTALLKSVLAEYPEYINIMVAAVPSGTVFASGVPTKKPLNLSDREYYRRVLQTRGYVVGEFRSRPGSSE